MTLTSPSTESRTERGDSLTGAVCASGRRAFERRTRSQRRRDLHGHEHRDVDRERQAALAPLAGQVATSIPSTSSLTKNSLSSSMPTS